MIFSWRQQIQKINRTSLVSIILLICTFGSLGCLTTRVSLPRELPVMLPLNLTDLVSKVNSFQQINQLKSAIGIQFIDYKESQNGKGKIYPSANGFLILKRPESIRLVIDATIVGKIADMGSDGKHFSVAIYYPPEKRSFIKGTNSKIYNVPRNALSGVQNKQEVSSFSKLRPQHFTLPLLIPSILESTDINYFVVESRRDEPASADTPSHSISMEPSVQRVLKTYYVLYVAHRKENGQWVPLYGYWFDRTRIGTPLTRLQIFEENGILSTEAEYSYTKEQLLPQQVQITRPHDGYAVLITFHQTDTNPTSIPSDIFTVRNEENLQPFDLDASNTSSVQIKKNNFDAK